VTNAAIHKLEHSRNLTTRHQVRSARLFLMRIGHGWLGSVCGGHAQHRASPQALDES